MNEQAAEENTRLRERVAVLESELHSAYLHGYVSKSCEASDHGYHECKECDRQWGGPTHEPCAIQPNDLESGQHENLDIVDEQKQPFDVRAGCTVRFGLLFRLSSAWVGVHWSPYYRRLCINLVPFVTIWITLRGGMTPEESKTCAIATPTTSN